MVDGADEPQRPPFAHAFIASIHTMQTSHFIIDYCDRTYLFVHAKCVFVHGQIGQIGTNRQKCVFVHGQIGQIGTNRQKNVGKNTMQTSHFIALMC